MRAITAGIAAAALTIGLAACGSGGGGTAASQPPTATQVAQQIGATDVRQIEPTLYAYDEAIATWHGRAVDIATFRNAALRDRWADTARQFTGIIQVGPLYVVADA